MWINQSHYVLLLNSLDHANERAKVAEQQLATERAEHFRIVQHWANMFLRAKAGANSFPVPDGSTPLELEDEPVLQPTIDPGELEVLVEEGARMGMERDEVVAKVYESRGISMPV